MSSDYPLVSLIVTGYNQEKYICEAIKGAFIQNYQPLEIILSDDYSNDNTFSIMEQMANCYRGSHTIRLRRSISNRATFNHLLECAAEANGQIIVLAEGDDISYQNRVSTIVERWKSGDAKIFCSYADLINESSEVIGKVEWSTESGWRELRDWFNHDWPMTSLNGASLAFDKDIIQNVKLSDEKIYLEDKVISFIALLRGYNMELIREPLIAYRTHSKATVNHNLKLDLENLKELSDYFYQIEKRCAFHEIDSLNIYKYILNTVDSYSYPNSDPEKISKLKSLITKSMQSLEPFASFRSIFLNGTTQERLLTVLRLFASPENINFAILKFILPRLFGLRFFLYTKSIFHFSKGVIKRMIA